MELLIFYISLFILIVNGATHPGARHHHSKGWEWTKNPNVIPHLRKITTDCVVTMKNATFNLAPLYLNPLAHGQLQYYTVRDTRSEWNPDDDYEYAFNVCGPVLTIPDGCKPSQLGTNRSYCEDNNLTTLDNGTIYCNVPMTHIGNTNGIFYMLYIPYCDTSDTFGPIANVQGYVVYVR